ncbi:germination protein [Brevibacillus reuszeri]|uniref:GerAB/ArcD/ProY family transporter n=1 Tax=Brevibacillus reuszeri TaxID=54915 RepID=UPI001B070564|nr:endospore germination permease [Brevibacillus reuszeri]GIO05309.1 germination protein [Brevibacillus reuszeri]
MKKYAYNEITLLQYIFLIHGAQVGIGVLSMPRDLAEVANTDGWVSLFLGWILAVVASLLIISIMKRYPDYSITDLLPLFLGKWLGKACVLLVAIYCGLASLAVTGNTVAIVNVWILTQTPGYIVVLLLAIPIYFIVRGGLRIIGRYAELIFYLTLWMPIVLMASFKDTHWIHLLPFFKEGLKPIIIAAKSTILSFLGFELAFFLYPFLQKKQYASLGIVIANTLSLGVFLSVTIFSFAFFSPDEITEYTWPTLNLWKVIEYRFLERIDIIFLAFYLMILSTTAIPYIYFTVFSTSQLFGKADHRGHLKIVIPLMVILFWAYTPSFADLKKWTEMWSVAGFFVGFLFPLLICVPIWLLNRHAGGRKA